MMGQPDGPQIYYIKPLISLAQFNQYAAGGFGMEEGDLCAAGPDSGFLVDQPDPFGLELRQGLFDVVHAESHMLDAFALLFNVLGDRSVDP